ncbi:hypothetical protein Leryth_016533 [Lithospermum erythrorhizon]|nr:hypothetical protein Leryth_016533 [Lithospermum erythrorhizon]
MERKWKYRPLPASSGHILTVDCFPECKPLPVLSMHFATVC